MEQMLEALKKIESEAKTVFGRVSDRDELNNLRIRYLGKKGELTGILKGMGKLSGEDRPKVGQVANEIRQTLEEVISKKSEELEEAALKQQIEAEKIDVTLAGTKIECGHFHPLTRIIDEIKDIFLGMGYEIGEGPEIENDYNNFEGLNLPKDHPARDMQDSFYISEDILLRTHTSPMQVRTMAAKVPEYPVKVICPGRVFRRDDDATHSPMFHQIEGLVIDENISMADLKGTLLKVMQQLFGPDREIRLRPSYFPFTEPSTEVDVSCGICGGKGCRTCSDSGWLEILGAGMVHPHVLEMAGYDSTKLQGFAFGFGVERIAMLKYGIDDLRVFYDNDVRFLGEF